MNHSGYYIIIPVMVIIIILTVFLYTNNNKCQNQLQSNDSIEIPNKFRLISRREWVAQPPNEPLNNLETPVTRVIIAHSITENCTTQASCTFQVRTIQTYHIESRGWDDIGYNFLIGGDGASYEGRGWDKEGAHTKGYNRGSICITFIGTFTRYAPPQRQIDAAKLLLEEGVRLGKLDDNYKLYGHRQFMATESPGQKLYDIITKWPHFSDNIE